VLTRAWSAPPVGDVFAQERRNRSIRRATYVSLLLLSLLVAASASRSMAPSFWLTAVLLTLGTAAVLARPFVGVYIVVGFGLIADNTAAFSYPFVKNASSRESVFFLDDRMSLSPLEFVLLVTTVAWLLSRLGERPRLVGGSLVRPISVFTGFVVFGLVNGLLTGGDRNVALWQVRPLLYFPLVYLLTINLFTRKAHYHVLFWVIATALFIEGVNGVRFFVTLSTGAAQFLEGRSLVEHAAALHMNTLLLLFFSVWLFRGGSWAMRLVLPILLVPVAIVYINSERRSAFVALIAGLLVMGAVLFWHKRAVFWVIVPPVVLLFGIYLAAFWNLDTPAGFPAQAVKTVVAPGELSEHDQGSSEYRDIETHNLVTTINAAPLRGIGFGQKFYRPLALPDISFFPFWEYIPHNSVLGLWTQVGAGGFVAFLYLVATAISRGLATVKRVAPSDEAPLVLTATLLFVMFPVFAWVDMSWEPQTALYLGVAAAKIAHFEGRAFAEAAPVPTAGAQGREPTAATGEPEVAAIPA
jgi:hypothetical protein